ncbi:MAG: hypothetical protein IID33_03180 [Planctomycetes bacterium]|nr:hypothetical protein [Planctomycetota bacterium]
MTERFSGMLAALGEFTAALDGQLAARPAPVIAAALEECSGLAEDFEQNVRAVEQRWAAWRGKLATMEVADDVVDLFQQQAVADEAARRLVRDCADWLAAVEQRLDRLKEGEGGATRQMVIVTALRSGLARIDLARKDAAKAARAVGRSSNFRLDAHDMRLRGLQTRLSRRRGQVRSNLQNRADRRTVAQRDSELAATRDRVEEYESLRGELVIELIDRMDAVRGLDDDMLERSQLEAAIRRHSGELTRLEEQDRYLAGQLDEARRSGPQPDRIVAVTDQGSEQTAGARRWSHAATAGAAVSGTVWLFCVLMILRNPFRRDRSLAETLGFGESAGTELTAEAR